MLAPVTATLAERGAIYPRSVAGRFARWRWVFVWLTQAVFYGLPWLIWGGRQAVLFDLDAQRFFIFGLLLHPQDLIYLAALLVLSALALFFFTAVAGRLWCGYACPQTVYTEIFLWTERMIEGDRSARMRLDKSPWTTEKVLRKTGKQAAWLGIGLYTGFTFVGYFTPIRELAVALGSGVASPWNLFWMLFYAGATYGNAGLMREQMCRHICPYARFQSALIDADSLIVTYDVARGEPRGARSRKAAASPAARGDCVDCTLCVQVCPMGIDIRQGLQNECIGCAACVDACDGVMDKLGAPRGLIRYSSANAMAGGWSRRRMLRRVWRPRVLIYGGVLLLAAVGFSVSLALRSSFQFDIIKDRGTLARIVEDGAIENVYRVRIMNRSEAPRVFRLRVNGPRDLHVSAPETTVAAAAIQTVVVRLRLPEDGARSLAGQSVPVVFELQAAADGAHPMTARTERSTFTVPR